MGSATVMYEDDSDAAKAIEEYHGATLDDKVLTVEYDYSELVHVPKSFNKNGFKLSSGKTVILASKLE